MFSISMSIVACHSFASGMLSASQIVCVMESVRGEGPMWSNVVQHDLRVRRELGELPIKKRNLPVHQQELYLWGLSCALMTRDLQGKKWGDG
jgi:hypothetical protein